MTYNMEEHSLLQLAGLSCLGHKVLCVAAFCLNPKEYKRLILSFLAFSNLFTLEAEGVSDGP